MRRQNSRKPRFKVGDLLYGEPHHAPEGRYIIITKVESRSTNSLYHFREIANNKSVYWLCSDIERTYEMIG
jgi:hypothetical protein